MGQKGTWFVRRYFEEQLRCHLLRFFEVGGFPFCSRFLFNNELP